MFTEPVAVKGDPDLLDDLASACRRTAAALREDAARLRASEARDWSGPAARAFTASLHGVPRELAHAAESYDTVARALSSYAADLRHLLPAARRTIGELGDLDGRLLAERERPVDGSDPAAEVVRATRVAAFEQERSSIRSRLAGLGGEAETAASTAACLIRSACDAPNSAPGLWERLADGAGDWVQDHAEVLRDISSVLKVVAAVAGALMTVPVLAPVFGPLAAAAAVSALCIDAALASQGQESWLGVGIDAVMASLPVRGLRSRLGIESADRGFSEYREARARHGSVVVYRVEGTVNHRVVIDARHDVTFRGRRMLYLTVGDRARAETYYRQKRAGGLAGVQLKAFRIPTMVHRQLSLAAVDQHLAKAFPDRPQRVDTSRSMEQYGLRKIHFRQLEKEILPGSGRVLR